MKVVLFCGGLGLRLRDHDQAVPKPMLLLGKRPVLWHIMKFYAHHGHKDFILCLGYRGELIKRYFLDYDESLSNDFVLSGGEKQPQLLHRDIQDWRITFVETGLNATIGERLLKVRPFLEGQEMFLANYSDDLSDAPINDWIAYLRARPDLVGSFLAVTPQLSLHSVTLDEEGIAQDMQEIARSGILVNGGYFVFRTSIFDYLDVGEDLVTHAFPRLMRQRALVGHRHRGFWAALDTFKDLRYLEGIIEAGGPPWAVWQQPSLPLAKAGDAIGALPVERSTTNASPRGTGAVGPAARPTGDLP